MVQVLALIDSKESLKMVVQNDGEFSEEPLTSYDSANEYINIVRSAGTMKIIIPINPMRRLM